VNLLEEIRLKAEDKDFSGIYDLEIINLIFGTGMNDQYILESFKND